MSNYPPHYSLSTQEDQRALHGAAVCCAHLPDTCQPSFLRKTGQDNVEVRKRRWLGLKVLLALLSGSLCLNQQYHESKARKGFFKYIMYNVKALETG